MPFAGALLKKEVDYDYFINNYMTRKGDSYFMRRPFITMFIDFFYILRKRKVPVSFTEWMTLIGRLRKDTSMTSTSLLFGQSDSGKK